MSSERTCAKGEQGRRRRRRRMEDGGGEWRISKETGSKLAQVPKRWVSDDHVLVQVVIEQCNSTTCGHASHA